MEKYMKNIKNWWKNLDKKKFLYFQLLPLFLTLLFGFYFGLTMNVGGNKKQNRTPVPEITSSISNSVDLPTQIKEIQSKELLVLESQLGTISKGTDIAKDSDFQTMLVGLTENNDLNSFFDGLLALDYKQDVSTQYKALSKYLATDNYSVEGESDQTVESNIYDFLKGNSYSKETKSQTAKAGTVLVSLMTGSNQKNRYYTCIVPTTNGKNQQVNLIYFVQMSQSGKVIDVAYGGRLSEKITTTLTDLKQLFTEVETEEK